MAGGDDCRTRGEGGIREEIAAGGAGKSLREGEMKIGFIGLGMMCSGMAANLQKAGHELVVHDYASCRGEPYLAAGAVWADHAACIAEAAEVVFTSLPGPPRSRRWRWARTACSPA